MTERELERAAIAGHKAGQTWTEWWRQYDVHVRRLEPYNLARFRKLADKLLMLVFFGDLNGQRPVDPEPWERDDQANAATPSDTMTAAKLQWQPRRAMR